MVVHHLGVRAIRSEVKPWFNHRIQSPQRSAAVPTWREDVQREKIAWVFHWWTVFLREEEDDPMYSVRKYLYVIHLHFFVLTQWVDSFPEDKITVAASSSCDHLPPLPLWGGASPWAKNRGCPPAVLGLGA